MSIRKRESSPFWWYSFSIDGERFRGSTHTADRKLASEYEAKLRTEAYSQRKLGKKPEITLENVLAKYWKEHAQEQAWATSVWGYMRHFAEAWGAHAYLSDINDARYSELVSRLKKHGLKPGTINRHLQCFRKVYRLARDVWGYDVAQINFALHRLKEPDSRVRYLTTEEAVRLIEQAADHLKPIIRFALYTGVRKSNILNLRWKDVDMVGKRIIFKVKSHMPGGKNHTVPMVGELYDLLVQLKGRHPIYVFTYKGQPISGIKNSFAGACKKAKLQDFRFHDLRHTCASWLVQDGAQLAVVRDILGHSSSKMTEKYAHHDKKQRKDALEHTFGVRFGHIKESL